MCYNIFGENMTKIKNIKMCYKFKDRLIGNCFKTEIDNILCFPNCNSIHTFFMKVSIDVIILNKEYKIIYIKTNFKPWKILWPKKNGFYTLEFPHNSTKYKLGDIIEF